MSNIKVLILRGVSGSGKSSLAEKLTARESAEDEDRWVYVLSADDFFTDENGKYIFNPDLLSQAHASCMMRFIEAIDPERGACDDDVVIVDNTNTTIWEMSPYVLVAQAFGIEPEIVVVETSLSNEELAARNLHGVPSHVIDAQRKRIEENPLPPWWKIRKV